MGRDDSGRGGPLFPLRDKLLDIIRGLGTANDYREQIANAFRFALDGQLVIGEQLLNDMITKGRSVPTARSSGAVLGQVVDVHPPCAQNVRRKWAAVNYVACSTGLSIFFAVMFLEAAGDLLYASPTGAAAAPEPTPPKLPSTVELGFLALSMGGGALGALLSIALQLVNRSIVADEDVATNYLDAVMRVLVGVISGGMIHLLLASQLTSERFGGRLSSRAVCRNPES